MTKNDRFLGLIVLSLSLLYGFEASQFDVPFGGYESVGPSTFPIILSIIMMVCGIYFLLKPDKDNSWPPLSTAIEIILVLSVLAIFATIITSAGFVIAATLMVGFVSLRMGATKKGAIATGILSSVSIYLLFNIVLELHLPAGILGF